MRGTVHLIGILLLVSGGVGWVFMATLALRQLEKRLGMQPAAIVIPSDANRLKAAQASHTPDRLPFIVMR